MEDKKYHHGNLKQELIEAGIELISKYGEEGLSLRKAAAKCNVSQAAPYAHFKNKNDLIHQMQGYVTEKFVQKLNAAALGKEQFSEEIIISIGEAYVNFFIDNPNYFKFMWFTPYLNIYLSTEDRNDVYPPFEIFKKQALGFLKKNNYDQECYLRCMTNMWATVQGLAMLVTQGNVTYAGNLKKDLHKILLNR